MWLNTAMTSNSARNALAAGLKAAAEGEAIVHTALAEIRNTPKPEPASLPPSPAELLAFTMDRVEHDRIAAAMPAIMTICERFPFVRRMLAVEMANSTRPTAEPVPEDVHQIVHQNTKDPRGRKPIGDKPLSDKEKKRRYRARKKAAQAQPQPEPPASSSSVDLFDLHPSDEANDTAGKVYSFLERFSLQLQPWFARELSPDDREILRYALNSGVNTLGQWALDLWEDKAS